MSTIHLFKEAISFGNVLQVKAYLSNNNLDINMNNAWPLHECVEKGFAQIIRLLIKYGADVEMLYQHYEEPKKKT